MKLLIALISILFLVLFSDVSDATCNPTSNCTDVA